MKDIPVKRIEGNKRDYKLAMGLWFCCNYVKFKFKLIYSHLFNYNTTTITKKKKR